MSCNLVSAPRKRHLSHAHDLLACCFFDQKMTQQHARLLIMHSSPTPLAMSTQRNHAICFEMLPDEIISIILIDPCRSYYHDIANYRELAKYRCAITAVSTSWRRAALSTSKLWSLIKVSTTGSRIVEIPVEVTELFLQRSVRAPALDLYIRSVYLDEAAAQMIWSLLQDSTIRCRSLRMDVAGHAFLHPLPGPMPLLTELHIVFSGSGEPAPGVPHEEPPISLSSQDAPAMTTMHISGLRPNGIKSIPPQQLTRLSLKQYIDMGDWENLHSFLVECENLTHLLYDGFFPSSNSMPLDPVSFPRLQFLCVNSPRFRKYIQAPNLMHLRCDNLAANFAALPTDFPVLYRLDIANFRQSIKAWSEHPYVPSHIQYLRLETVRDTTPFVRSLAESVAGDNGGASLSPFFPALERLRIGPLTYIGEEGVNECVRDIELAPALSDLLAARPNLSVIVDSLTIWKDMKFPEHLRPRICPAERASAIKLTFDDYL
ncbi:hypothetical protein DL93DRAFT_161713 [Clavulina sp. PMI_390]|nr:hypothetical protein DL93DRAFT_161713 [Clavulina sp. PMI_390]